MIKVKHPSVNCNIEQENFINNLDDSKREYWSLHFSYGNAAYLYHDLPIEPTFQDYLDWMEG